MKKVSVFIKKSTDKSHLVNPSVNRKLENDIEKLYKDVESLNSQGFKNPHELLDVNGEKITQKLADFLFKLSQELKKTTTRLGAPTIKKGHHDLELNTSAELTYTDITFHLSANSYQSGSHGLKDITLKINSSFYNKTTPLKDFYLSNVSSYL